jgi:hypothetical protein
MRFGALDNWTYFPPSRDGGRGMISDDLNVGPFDDVPHGPIDDQPRVRISLDPNALRAAEIALQLVAGRLEPDTPQAEDPDELFYELQSEEMRAAFARATAALRRRQ